MTTSKRTFPLGVAYDNMTHQNRGQNTEIRISQPYPDPEIKGYGQVISKDGKVKTDGSHIKQRGS